MAMVVEERQSNLSKRKRLLDSGEIEQRTPVKRPKVAFNPDVHVRIVEEVGEKSVDLIQEEVLLAIHKHQDNDDEAYNEIRQLFSKRTDDEDAPSSSLLRKYLMVLSNNTTLLKKNTCAELVYSILETRWLARDEAFVKSYVHFLGHLTTSQTGYVAGVIKVLVQNFSHVSFSAGRSAISSSIERAKVGDCVHMALKHILHLVPSASSILTRILTQQFPFPTDSVRSHINYVDNLLKLTVYAPELKTDVIDLIVGAVVIIDSQVQIEIEELEDAEEAVGSILTGLPHELGFEHAEPEDNASDTDSVLSDNSVEPETKRIKELREAVQKMDGILDRLFEHLEPSFSKALHHESHSVFHLLESQLRKTLFPATRSRHTQFLLFRAAQSSAELTAHFVDACFRMILDRSSKHRISAAAYLASFVARGARVSSETVVYVFDRLSDYVKTLDREYRPTCRGPDRRYKVYYAAVQALIYIFCFRWRDLLNDPSDADTDGEDEEYVWAPGVKDAFICLKSKLNPLKMIASEVVEEFCRITHQLRFLYVYGLVEANKMLRLRSRGELPVQDAQTASLNRDVSYQLDAYFPFDPYRLPISKRWLVGYYNEWQGEKSLEHRHTEGRGDSSEGEVEEGEELDVEDQGTETPIDSD